VEKELCTFCLKLKTPIRCDECGVPTCKHCTSFTDESSFKFSEFLPEKLIDKAFCPNCYDDGISDELGVFQSALARAGQVDVFEKNQGKETRLMRRLEEPVEVKDYPDREGALLYLAFQAALKGFNILVDVDLKSKKVSGGGKYKKLVWSGRGTPMAARTYRPKTR